LRVLARASISSRERSACNFLTIRSGLRTSDQPRSSARNSSLRIPRTHENAVFAGSVTGIQKSVLIQKAPAKVNMDPLQVRTGRGDAQRPGYGWDVVKNGAARGKGTVFR